MAEDAWVLASVAPSFSIARPWPNPARERASLSFTVQAGATATLEVMDVAGRRVWSRRFDSPAAGPHVVSLARTDVARAGLYFVRLTQSGRSRTTRVVWVP